MGDSDELRILRYRLDALLTEFEYRRESSPSRGAPAFVGQIYNGGQMATGDGPNYCLVHPVTNIGGTDPEGEGVEVVLITDDTVSVPVALENKAVVGDYIIATQLDGRWVSGAARVRKFCVVVGSQCGSPPTNPVRLYTCSEASTPFDFNVPYPLPHVGDAMLPIPEGLVVTITDGATPPNVIVSQALTGQLGLGVIAGGHGFTSLPTIVVTDPTGTGAKFYPVMAIDQTTIAVGGANYKVGDILKLTGLQWQIPARYTVTAVDGNGTITALSPITDAAPTGGPFTVLPTGPVGLDGGSGSDATVTLTFSLYQVIVTDPGKMYTQGQVAATVVGGGGIGALVEASATYKICTGPIQPGVYFVSFDGIPAAPPNTGSLPFYHGYYVTSALGTTTQTISLQPEKCLFTAAVGPGTFDYPLGPYRGDYRGLYSNAVVSVPTAPTWTPCDYYYPDILGADPLFRANLLASTCFPLIILQNACVFTSVDHDQTNVILRYPDSIILEFDNNPLWGDRAGKLIIVDCCKPFWSNNTYQLEVNGVLMTVTLFWHNLGFALNQDRPYLEAYVNFTGLDHDPCFYADPTNGVYYTALPLGDSTEDQSGVLTFGQDADYTALAFNETSSLTCRCNIIGVDVHGNPICAGGVAFNEYVAFLTILATGGPYD